MCLCVCACAREELTFGGSGGATFCLVVGDSLHTSPLPPNRENSAIPEKNLGHKIQQNCNRKTPHFFQLGLLKLNLTLFLDQLRLA